MSSYADWPMYMHDPAHTGVVDEGVEPPLGLLWKHQIGQPIGYYNDIIYSSPTIFGGILYIGLSKETLTSKSLDGYVFALDAKTGELKWKYKTGEVPTSPAISGGFVYAGSKDEYVYALDAVTGELKWKYKTGGGVFSSPIVFGDVVYFGSSDDYIYALYAKTGELKWKYKTGGDVSSSPAISDGFVYVGSRDEYVYALDAETGELKWLYKTGDSVYSSPAVFGAVVYFGSYDDYIYALDAKTGELKWKYKTGAGISSSPAISGGFVYVGSRDEYVYALDAETGELKWLYKTGDSVYSSPAVFGAVVYFGSYDDYIYALDAKTGELKWKYKTDDSVISSPAISDSIVYVGSSDTTVYAFTFQSDVTLLSILELKQIIMNEELKGLDVSSAKKHFSKAEGAFKKGNYDEADELIATSKKSLDSLNKILNTKKIIHEEKINGFDVSSVLSILSNAEEAFDKENYYSVNIYAEQANKLAQDIDQDGITNNVDFVPTIHNNTVYGGIAFLIFSFFSFIKIKSNIRKKRLKRLKNDAEDLISSTPYVSVKLIYETRKAFDSGKYSKVNKLVKEIKDYKLKAEPLVRKSEKLFRNKMLKDGLSESLVKNANDKIRASSFDEAEKLLKEAEIASENENRILIKINSLQSDIPKEYNSYIKDTTSFLDKSLNELKKGNFDDADSLINKVKETFLEELEKAKYEKEKADLVKEIKNELE